MDKSWTLESNRLSSKYLDGMEEFLDFAFKKACRSEILCPCMQCNNGFYKSRDDVKYHLLKWGIVPTYTTWYYHGEESAEFFYQSSNNSEDEDRIDAMLAEGLGAYATQNSEEDCDSSDGADCDSSDGADSEEDCDSSDGADCDSSDGADCDFSEEADCDGQSDEGEKAFATLLEDAKQSLYPGCTEFSKLSFVVKLLHLKCLHGWSDKSVTSLLELLKMAFPQASLPGSYYEARKVIKDLGLDYVKIHVCPKNCMLFRRENLNLDTCIKCGSSRWKSVTQDDGSKKKVPAKVLRYFPLKPRLQRLFRCSETASDMRWHAEKRPKDGLLRHPSDSPAWKKLDEFDPSFASEKRNVRFGFASDGVNPYGHQSSSYSIWPVVLVPYNLPPWLCMKKPFFLLSLLIPGPKSPGDAIDVFLEPLIEELEDLWKTGVDTYDASKKEYFRLRAAVLWTINDFPAYGNLSGYSTKGRWACPHCNKDTWHLHLKNSRKLCYMGHRRWLKMNHRWRKDKAHFDGKVEKRDKPSLLSGDDILQLLNVLYGENSRPIKDKNDCRKQWKKKSIFFRLPYWKHLLLRHNLDVMHIEKNILESVVGTLLNIDGKTKDGENARKDLEEMGIRETLHLIPMTKKPPPALFTMSPNEKFKLCQFLKKVKLPDGFGSNIARCVNLKERKIHSLKSHDCHMLMQRLLPMAIHDILPKDVREPLIQLSYFFRKLCSKVLEVDSLEGLESQIVQILCKLEMIFPPSFFDIMVHLPIHLAWEAKMAGPVQYRWMYPIERYLRTLKSYVRNKSQPEGSISEGYLAEECLTFCSRYLGGIETIFNRKERNDDGGQVSSEGLTIFMQSARPLGSGKPYELSREEWCQARLYVLNNCDEVQPYKEQHKHLIATSSSCTNDEEMDKIHDMEFPSWFESQVTTLSKLGNEGINNQLLSLARGPVRNVLSYKGCIVNGFRFHTKDREKDLRTQNSGVFVEGLTNMGSIDYYGILTDVIELQYLGGNRVILFNCCWMNVHSPGKGIKVDAHGFTQVNFSQILRTNEPFVLASQAEQVFYVSEKLGSDWHIVQKTQPRNFYDMKSKEEELNEDAFQENEAPKFQSSTLENDVVAWHRTDIPTEDLNEAKVSRQSKKKGRRIEKDVKRSRKRRRKVCNDEELDEDNV